MNESLHLSSISGETKNIFFKILGNDRETRCSKKSTSRKIFTSIELLSLKKIHHIKKLKAGRLFLTQILESKTLQIS